MDSLTLRHRIFQAYLQNDADLITRLVGPTAPHSGYEKDFNLMHLAVCTGESHLLKLTIQLIGSGWEMLCARRNSRGQTPRELGIELGMVSLVVELDDLLCGRAATKQSKVKSGPKLDEKRVQMPIEDEIREEQLDGWGRKSQQKLIANNRGKAFWKG